jgi:hypothetical protein
VQPDEKKMFVLRENNLATPSLRHSPVLQDVERIRTPGRRRYRLEHDCE